jgi:hypothetical protein
VWVLVSGWLEQLAPDSQGRFNSLNNAALQGALQQLYSIRQGFGAITLQVS